MWRRRQVKAKKKQKKWWWRRGRRRSKRRRWKRKRRGEFFPNPQLSSFASSTSNKTSQMNKLQTVPDLKRFDLWFFFFFFYFMVVWSYTHLIENALGILNIFPGFPYAVWYWAAVAAAPSQPHGHNTK